MTEPTSATNSQSVGLTQPSDNNSIIPSQNDAPKSALSALNVNAAHIVIAGERRAEFDELVRAVFEFWQPEDVVDELLMADFVHAEWELRRLRRLVPAAFVAGRPFAVSKLAGFAEERFSDSAFPRGTYKEALADLAAKGHTCDVLDAQTLLMHTAAFESFDKRAAVLEVRRDSAWDKAERRRSAVKTISSPALSENDR